MPDELHELVEVYHPAVLLDEVRVENPNTLAIPMLVSDTEPFYKWEDEGSHGEYDHHVYVYKCRESRLLIRNVESFKIFYSGRDTLDEMRYSDGTLSIFGSAGAPKAGSVEELIELYELCNTSNSPSIEARTRGLGVEFEIADCAADIVAVHEMPDGVQFVSHGEEQIMESLRLSSCTFNTIPVEALMREIHDAARL